MATQLKTASVLAFERKLDVSDSLFFSGNWDDRETAEEWSPVVVREKSVRGTISNRLKAKDQDPAKLDAQIQKPNLQTVDTATLPHSHDTLLVRFTVRVLGKVGQPSACNDTDYLARLSETIRAYINTNGFSPLAKRYAVNLANGRFLWRNRLGAESVEVRVRQRSKGATRHQWSFDGLQTSMRSFDSENESIDSIAKVIAEGFAGENHVLLDVLAFARIGNGQEVYPSQELIMNRESGDKSKTLYVVGGVAAQHSQKIGNAVRTIDTWYDESVEIGPIAVEPYGSVTSNGKAYRQPKQKLDFYSLLDRWVLSGDTPALEQQHFVMAILIRGGVFGEGTK